MSFEFGQEIECNYQGKGKWLAGKVMGVREEGNAFDVLFDDGNGESEVSPARLRTKTARKENRDADEERGMGQSALSVGATVEMRCHVTKSWVPVTIEAEDKSLGTFDVALLRDGSKSRGVPASLLRISTPITKDDCESCDVTGNYAASPELQREAILQDIETELPSFSLSQLKRLCEAIAIIRGEG